MTNRILNPTALNDNVKVQNLNEFAKYLNKGDYVVCRQRPLGVSYGGALEVSLILAPSCVPVAGKHYSPATRCFVMRYLGGSRWIIIRAHGRLNLETRERPVDENIYYPRTFGTCKVAEGMSFHPAYTRVLLSDNIDNYINNYDLYEETN